MSAILAYIGPMFLNWAWAKILAAVTALIAVYKANQIIQSNADAAKAALDKSVSEQERQDAARDTLNHL